MNTSVYGSRFVSSASGLTIAIDPEQVVYADDAIERCPEILSAHSPNSSVTVVADERTKVIAGDALIEQLTRNGWQVHSVLVADNGDHPPVCDDITFRALLSEIGEPEVLLAVGSGVINDLCKWLAFSRRIPYAVFATAASMNGYTSANVAPTINGVKSLEYGAAPKLVLSTPQIIADAPYEMTVSGLGDILAKSVSTLDWYTNHILFGDLLIPESVDLISEVEPLYLDHPRDVLERKPEALEGLFQGLMLTGVAMTMAGSSAPASGGEHLISHTLDMMASRDGVEHDFHGRQVGVGTVLTAALYDRVMAMDVPDFNAERAIATDFSFWGDLSDEVRNTYAPKVERIRSAAQRLSQPGEWNNLRAQLGPLIRPASRIRDCLRGAEAACSAEDLGCTQERLVTAVLHAHEIRARFTVLDLARMVGLMPTCAQDLIAELL